MTEDFIQLKKPNIVRLKIVDFEGKDTGEFLEFDVEDTQMPIRYQEMIEKDKKNRQHLDNQLKIIDKRQDVKGKKLMSKNEEDKIRAVNDFFQKEVEVYDMFLGKDGVKKMLNGRKMTWTTLLEISEIIEKQIFPHLKKSAKTAEERLAEIKEKYSRKESNVLKND